jgi:hypothetical protein
LQQSFRLKIKWFSRYKNPGKIDSDEKAGYCLGAVATTWFNGGSDDTAILPLLLPKIRSFRMLDTIVCSGSLVWLFSPAWGAVTLTLDVGFICPFVVIDPAD